MNKITISINEAGHFVVTLHTGQVMTFEKLESLERSIGSMLHHLHTVYKPVGNAAGQKSLAGAEPPLES